MNFLNLQRCKTSRLCIENETTQSKNLTEARSYQKLFGIQRVNPLEDSTLHISFIIQSLHHLLELRKSNQAQIFFTSYSNVLNPVSIGHNHFMLQDLSSGLNDCGSGHLCWGHSPQNVDHF